jgi:ATP-binding cassette subfamily B protein
MSELCTLETDLLPDGTFGVERLVLTTDRLQVHSGDRVRVDVALAELHAPRVEGLVGGSAIEAVVRGEPIEVIRYSDAYAARFAPVAKYLSDFVAHREADGTAPVLEPLAETPNRCPRCKLLLPEGSKACPSCVSRGRVILRILRYLVPYRARIAVFAALMLASTALGMVAPYLTRPLFDVVLVPQGATRSVQQRLIWLGLIVAGMLVTQLFAQLLEIVQGRIAVFMTHSLAHRLRVELYAHLQLLSLRFYDKQKVGSLHTRVSRDTEEMESILTVAAQMFLSNVLMLVGIAIVLCALNWRLFVCVILPAPLVALLAALAWRRIDRVWPRWWHTRSVMNAYLNESITGVRVVRAFAQEAREEGRFEPRSKRVADAGLAAEGMWVTVWPLLNFVTHTSLLIVWLVGGWMLLRGKLTAGTLLMFSAYLARFLGPLEFMNRLTEWIGRALAAADRIFEILDTVPDVADAGDAVAMPSIRGDVTFRHVTFGYDVHKPVLKDITLDIAAGEMVGLVGQSGAGKSTSINLVCRFYDVDQGELLIDGVPIRKIRQQDLRSQIGVVLQDTFLFAGTIADNICYAKPDATRAQILAAAKAANAHDFIVGKRDGYDTVVGERGMSLSGGERQRIAIARAILHDPRILILDEATSAVDTDTEQQIQEAIGRLCKGRTTFAIAHRLSTLRKADRLVVLKDGKIVEVGTHEELIGAQGEFHRLVRMQQALSQIHEVAR